MAAIDLSAADRTSWPYGVASLATTWQEFVLPPWCNQITIAGTEALYYSGSKGGTTASPVMPADGGAVNTTHSFQIPADTVIVMNIQGAPDTEVVGGGAKPTPSIFLASVSTLAALTIILERI